MKNMTIGLAFLLTAALLPGQAAPGRMATAGRQHVARRGVGSTTRTSAWAEVKPTHMAGHDRHQPLRRQRFAHRRFRTDVIYQRVRRQRHPHYGQGTTATSQYGGTATHSYGSGNTTYTNSYGTTATIRLITIRLIPIRLTTANDRKLLRFELQQLRGWSTAGRCSRAAVGMITGAAIASAGTPLQAPMRTVRAMLRKLKHGSFNKRL